MRRDMIRVFLNSEMQESFVRLWQKSFDWNDNLSGGLLVSQIPAFFLSMWCPAFSWPAAIWGEASASLSNQLTWYRNRFNPISQYFRLISSRISDHPCHFSDHPYNFLLLYRTPCLLHSDILFLESVDQSEEWVNQKVNASLGNTSCWWGRAKYELSMKLCF